MGSESFLSGGWLSTSAMPPQVPSLFKLVKFDHGGTICAPSDDEVARIEASFMQPELLQQERELLSINGGEEQERQSLLEQMQAYDLIVGRAHV